jgi:acyl-coenzyme A thioesterase PaaI-like protein
MTQAVGKEHCGVISEGQARTMSGLEFVRGLVDGTVPLNPMVETLGYDIVDVLMGRAVVTAEPQGKHRNPFGTVELFTVVLLQRCWMAAWGLLFYPMVDKGFAQTMLEFKISLVRDITPQTGLVKAEGKVISCGRRVRTAEGTLTDKDGRILAHGTTSCLMYEH